MEKFKDEEKEKIAKVLCAIAFAEKSYRLQDRLLARFFEQLAIFFRIDRYLCSTIGFLSLHIAHAKRFGYSEFPVSPCFGQSGPISPLCYPPYC